MERNPLYVSIVIPVYNAEKYIGQAIHSVLRQSSTNWELLVVNDGSNDKSKDIIHSFSDSRIKYFEQVNKGVSAARNVGLANMKGEYFCFLDADDVLPPDSLQNRLKVFKETENVHFVDGSVDFYDNTLTQKIKSWTPNFNGNPLRDLLSLSGKSFLGNTWMIKKHSYMHYAFENGLTHGEDLLFYINLARCGGLYSYTTEPILYYRTGHTSAMSDLKGLENGYKEVYKELQQMNDVPDDWKKMYYKKMKSIMLKSYLGKGELFNAMKMIFK